MYLEGELERGIVPDESVWMQGGGVGEDGCLLLLRKMNLELLRQCGLTPRTACHITLFDGFMKPKLPCRPHEAGEPVCPCICASLAVLLPMA